VKKRYILPVFLPFAGCASRCVYCDQEAITGCPPDKILSSAQNQIDEWKARRSRWDEIAFYGGTFAGLDKSLRLALYDMAAGSPVRVSTCPDSIDGEFITEAEERVSVIELGVQSLSDEVLKMNGRAYTSTYVLTLFKKLKELKCKTSAQFMTGLFGETRERFKESCDNISALEADFARIYPTVILPGAPLARMAADKEFVPLEPAESILRTAWLYIALTARNIKVIRISLPQGFNAGEYQGFYHHAYGEIVKTVTAYAGFLKRGVLPEGFSGYRGVLRKLNGQYTDFPGISRQLSGMYSVPEWLDSAALRNFTEGLL
jgi:histone acetyltransferase (RNA polymerase elongator complex component)